MSCGSPNLVHFCQRFEALMRPGTPALRMRHLRYALDRVLRFSLTKFSNTPDDDFTLSSRTSVWGNNKQNEINESTSGSYSE